MTVRPETPVSIGILGAGRVGTAIARQALLAGFDVRIATAKPADEISMLVDIVTPGARAVDAAEAAEADLVVVAIPLPKYRTVEPQLLAGKTVIDVMNYWAPTDGEVEEFERDARTTSEIVQEHLSGSKLVKTLNHIGYHDLEVDGRPAGAADRWALAVASDHDDARDMVADVIDRLGYDAVNAGPLAAGRLYQPGTEIFNGSHTAPQMRDLLTSAHAHAHP